MPLSSLGDVVVGTAADLGAMLAQRAHRAYQECGEQFCEGMGPGFRAYSQHQAEPCRLRLPVAASRRKALAVAFCAVLALAALVAVYAIWPPRAERGPHRGGRERREADDRYTRSLAGLAMAFLLLAVGLWLTERDLSKLDDCLVLGRTNCERIEMSRLR